MNCYGRVGLSILYLLLAGYGGIARGQTQDISPAQTTYRQGIAALQQGDLASARTAFETAVQMEPRSPDARNSLGWVLMLQGQVDAAIEQFRGALDLRPDFFQADTNLSNALLQKGDPKGAVRAAREAVRFGPTASETYRTLARALDASGDAAAAVVQMRRALQLEPGRAELHDEVGTLLVEASGVAGSTAADGASLKEAEKEYLEALRLQSDYEPAHLHLGVLRFQQKSLEEAIGQLREAVVLDPTDAQAHFYLGKALHERGDDAGAVHELEVPVRPPSTATARGNRAGRQPAQGPGDPAAAR
jgi:Flp pilus assembly protein TadD